MHKQLFKNISSNEKWNTITHGLGILFSIIALPLLIFHYIQNNTLIQLIGVSIYACSFLFLYIASTTYHYIQDEETKELWRKIDHISIYYMIAGSYVPFMLAYLAFDKALIFLTIMYSLVLTGTIFKIFLMGKFEKFSVFLYVFLGWMVIFIAKSFFGNASLLVSVLVVLGGLCYTGGIYFYVKDKKYYHTIWHIFVLIASILHFLAVFYI